jgi:hypothetical protein
VLTRSFVSRDLPQPGGHALRTLLAREHELEPFSPVRPRATARRVGALASGVGLAARLYRGGHCSRGSSLARSSPRTSRMPRPGPASSTAS